MTKEYKGPRDNKILNRVKSEAWSWKNTFTKTAGRGQ